MLTTVAAAGLACWLAQAEAAPPEPAPAEPAPAEPVPTPTRHPSSMGVAARYAHRLGAESTAIGPTSGFSLGATYQRRYLVVAERLGLGVDVDLFYDHFAADVQTAEPINGALPSPPDAQRVISQTSFAALQTLALDVTPVVVWVGGGGGVTIASLSSPEVALRPGTLSGVQPLVRAALGVDVEVAPRIAVGLRADFTRPFTHPTLKTTSGDTYRPFGDTFDVGVGVLYRF